MSTVVAQHILAQLGVVDKLRMIHANDQDRRVRVLAIKSYQAERFRGTYADLLADPRYRAATAFFLEELYGPQDFSSRDHQFARVVPSLVRIFPHELIDTVATLSDLHALSETLDDQMATTLIEPTVNANSYTEAWQRTGQPDLRAQQITATIKIGRALDRYTKSRWIRTTLRMMRGPANAAGLGALQHFLEAGFEAFGTMGGAKYFLETVEVRERALAKALFEASIA